MATSLQQQLQSFAAKSVKSAKVKNATIIFDPKDVEHIDNSTVYNLGLNGFVELKSKDGRFSDFETHLFSQSSAELNRDTLTKQENTKLDVHLVSFLRLLSPFVMQKAAHKVLEFLVRRFRIHFFNVTAFVECVLPYHSTHLFSRVIRILQLEGTQWSFLIPMGQATDGVPRSYIVKECIRDSTILLAVCEMVKQSVEAEASSKTLLSFYSVLLMEVIQEISVVSPSFLQPLLPYLFEGIKSATNLFRISSFMVISQLSSKVVFTPALVSSLLKQISKFIPANDADFRNSLGPILHVTQMQKIKRFPKSTGKFLMNHENLLVDHLVDLDQKFEINKFLGHFSKFLVRNVAKKRDQQSIDLLYNLVTLLTFNDENLKAIASSMWEILIADQKADAKDASLARSHSLVTSVDNVVKKILRFIENKKPVILDESIELALKTFAAEGNEERRSAFLNTVSSIFNESLKYQSVESTGTIMFLSLNSSDRRTREAAIHNMVKSLSDNRSADFLKFYGDSMLSLLEREEDEHIVSLILKAPSFILSQSLSNASLSALLDTLMKCIFKFKTEAILETAFALITGQLFFNVSLDFQKTILITLLNALPFRHGQFLVHVHISKVIMLLSPLFEQFNLLFAGLTESDVLSGSVSTDELSFRIAKQLATNLENTPETVDTLVSLFDADLLQPQARRILLCAIEKALPEIAKETPTQVIPLASLVLKQLALFPASNAQSSLSVHDLLSQVRKVIATPHGLVSLGDTAGHAFELVALKTIISVLNASGSPKDFEAHISNFAIKSTSAETSTPALVAQIFFLLLEKTEYHDFHKNLLAFLVNKMFPNYRFSFSILAIVIASPNSSSIVIMRALNLLQALIYVSLENLQHVKDTIQAFSEILAVLLIRLSHSSSYVRHAVFSVLSLVFENGSVASGNKLVIRPALFAIDRLPGSVASASNSFFSDTIISLIEVLQVAKSEIIGDNNYLRKFLKKAALNQDAKVFLMGQVYHLPFVTNQLDFIKLVQLISLAEKTSFYKSLLDFLAVPTNLTTATHYELANLILEQLSVDPANFASEPNFKILLSFFANHNVHSVSATKTLSPSISAIRALTQSFFGASAFSAERQKLIFTELVSAISANTDTEIKKAAQSKILELQFPASFFVTEIKAIVDLIENKEKATEASKKRIRDDAEEEESHPIALRVVSILELLQHKQNIPDVEAYLSILFSVVHKCMSPSALLLADTQDYMLFLVLVVLRSFVGLISTDTLAVSTSSSSSSKDAEENPKKKAKSSVQLIDSKKSQAAQIENHIDVKAIVDAIRSSSNPQIHNSALLLLAAISNLFPKKVIQQVMPIFTFMGANTLRQDDSYSFHVIQKTLQSVVPALLEESLTKGCWEVASIFVDNLYSIPSHRREPLFMLLAKSLTLPNLFTIMLLLLAKQGEAEAQEAAQPKKKVADDQSAPGAEVVVAAADDEDQSPKEKENFFSFFFSILQHFSPIVVVDCFAKSVESLYSFYEALNPAQQPAAKKPVGKSKGKATAQANSLEMAKSVPSGVKQEFFAISKIDKGSLVPNLRVQRLAIDFVSRALSDEGFLGHIISLSTRERQKLQLFLISLFKSLLLFLKSSIGLQQQQKSQNPVAFSDLSRGNAKQVANSLFKELVAANYDVLDKVQELLEIEHFIEAITTLLDHGDHQVRRRSLILLNEKLADSAIEYSESNMKSFSDLVTKLVSIVKRITVEESELMNLDEPISNKQTALFSLEILARKLVRYNPTMFANALTEAVIPCLESNNFHISTSALICTATHCAHLKLQAVELLPKLVPLVLDLVTRSIEYKPVSKPMVEDDEDNEDDEEISDQDTIGLMQVSCVSSLEVIVRSLSGFLSPYLERVIKIMTHPDVVDPTHSSAKQLLQKSDQILDHLAVHVEPRLILPALTANFLALYRSHNPKPIVRIVDLLAHVCQQMTRSQTLTQYSKLFKFFLALFDYRANAGPDTSAQQLNEVETSAIEAFISFALKLSEQLFKPLFLRLLDWAQASVAQKLNRYLMLFKLVDGITGKFKSLMVPYFIYLIDICTTLYRNPLRFLCSEQTPANIHKRKAQEEEDDDDDDADEEKQTASDAEEEEEQKLKAKEIETKIEELFDESKFEASKVIAADNVICYSISSLHKCFLYQPSAKQTSEEKFFTKERFDAIMSALVNLIDSRRTSAIYSQIVSCLAPCLGQLAVAVASQSFWQPLNYKVLMKTRDSSALVRLASISVLREFYERLGDEWIVLLPESVPFIGELMEDADQDVEKKCQELIEVINQHLGDEKIEDYLK